MEYKYEVVLEKGAVLEDLLKRSEEKRSAHMVSETQGEMAEGFIETLLTLKENYSHLDEELAHDLENLVADYEKYV